MKYKYNGQWYELALKTLDGLPVGTQVEFTGTTIPNGWEEVNDYSTTNEIDTGKRWTDGKKIYRKTYTGTTRTDNNYNIIDNNFPSTNYVVNVYGMVQNLSGNLSTFAVNGIYGSGGRFTFAYHSVSQDLFQMYNSEASTQLSYRITVEYTKSS